MTSPSEKKPRRKRLARAEAAGLPPFRLTPRDRAIIQAVYDYRVLNTRQIAALFFDPAQLAENGGGLSSRLFLRLQLLFQHGFLYRQEVAQNPTEPRRPLLYGLDEKGALVVARLLGCDVEDMDWDPRDRKLSNLFLEHLRATNTIRVAITLAAREHGFKTVEWQDDKTLKRTHVKDSVLIRGPQGGQTRVSVVPDGYFVLQAGQMRYHHFLETDLRTVTVRAGDWGKRDWARKVQAYLAYYDSGKYQERYHTKDMRVLTVTTGEKRLANLLAATESAGGRGRFWFTTLFEATPQAVLTGPIWRIAGREERRSLIPSP